MQKINLEEIIKLYSLNDTITTRQSFIYFGKQLLELAAENAKTGYTGTTMNNSGRLESGKTYIDKQSILDTIKQVQ